MITAKDAIANDSKMEWMAVSVIRKMGFTGFIKQHKTRIEQGYGDFSIPEDKVAIEIKHRGSWAYEDWKESGSLRIAIPHRWEEASEDTTFIHIDAFPEIGKVLVFIVEKGSWKRSLWNGKDCLNMIVGKENGNFQLEYTEKHLKIWNWRKGKRLY
jgi:hypothetical protein